MAGLSDTGAAVSERNVSYEEVLEADEAWSTGNYAKVLPITRVEGRNLQPGPIYKRARELYWAFAHGG